MLVPNRHGSSNSYRFGFNGKEMDNEIKGEGLQLDYGFRIYDPRIGKFLSQDPLFQSYPWFSPYHFAGNSPISCVDLDGLEMYFAADGSFLGQSIHGGNEIRIATKKSVFYQKDKQNNLKQMYKIVSSKALNQFDLATQGKVFQTIYNREVKGTATVIANDDQKSSTGAVTPYPLGEKAIEVNVDFSESMNDPKTGKEIYGIGNGDYFTAAANLKHEDFHFKGMGDNAGFDHFEVWSKTLKSLKKEGTFSKLNDFYKSYLNNVGGGYLQDMEFALSKTKTVSSEDFNYAYDLYVKNVATYNAMTKSDHNTGTKKEFLEARKSNK